MKWTTATALFLALSAGGVGVTAVLNREPKAPGDVLEDVERGMQATGFDLNEATLRLTAALEDERAKEAPELTERLLRQRAKIYRDLKMYAESKSDLEALLVLRAEIYRKAQTKVESDSDLDPQIKRDTLAKLKEEYDVQKMDLELQVVQLISNENLTREALARLQNIQHGDADFGEGLALRGQLEMDLANAQLRQAFVEAEKTLATSDAPRVRALITELVSRAPDDERRNVLGNQLTNAFYEDGDGAAVTVISKVVEPRQRFENARRDFADSLESILRPEIIVAFGSILERAGQIELSINLHRAARNLPTVANSPEALAAFLHQLIETNRIPEGVLVLRDWDYKNGGDLEFYRSAGEIFYRAKEYGPLGRIALGMDTFGAGLGDDWKRFFYSISPIITARALAAKPKKSPQERERLTEYREERIPDTVARLRSFVNDKESPEPFPGARAEAWLWLSEAYAFQGNRLGERKTLEEALASAVQPTSDNWVRLAELYKEKDGKTDWKKVEAALSEALNLDPSRTKELTPDWYQAGLMQLQKYNEELSDVIGLANRLGLSALNSDIVGPSVLTQIARHQLATGDPLAASRTALAAREEYRRLVPPLDILIRARMESSQRSTPEKLIIERIEAAGIDEQVEAYLSQLDGGRLDGEELVRAIKAAPERFGKAAVARYYLTLDDPARAGEALKEIKDATAPPELRLLRARLLVQGDQFQDALDELRALEREPRLRATALLLKLEAMIGAGMIRQLDPVAAEFQGLRATDAQEGKELLRIQLEAADLLSTCGRADLALANIDLLDRQAASRTPEFYRRRLLVDALTIDDRGVVPAQESILRAEPYLRDGTPEITAIVLAVAERKWAELPGLVDRLLDSKFRPTPKQEAALELLGERILSGTRATEDGLRSFPRDPEWAFLAAAAASLVDARIELPDWFGPRAARDAGKLFRGIANRQPQDPRDSLVLYLMAPQPEWSSWVVPRINEMARATGSELWTLWLRARVLHALDDRLAEAKAIARLTEDFPRFGPGHDASVRLFEEQHPTAPLHSQLVRARRIRLQSLGEELIANPIEIRLAKAGELFRREEYIKAVGELEPAVRSGGISVTEGRLILGFLMIKSEQYSLAALHLDEALSQDPGVFKETVIDHLLFALEKSVEQASTGQGPGQRGQLTEERALEMLRNLSSRYPLDPRVQLTELRLDELDLRSDEGVRARRVLERLFTNSGRKSLDQLRRGCTRPWVNYLLTCAPELAREILERDLVLEPGNLDLWELSGYVAEVQGDFSTARTYYETLLAIDDQRTETLFALASILIEEGSDLGRAKGLLRLASRRLAGGSAKANFLEAKADLRGRNPRLPEIIPRLRSLWDARERNKNQVDPADLGLLYADALFRELTSIDTEAARASVVIARRDDGRREEPLENPMPSPDAKAEEDRLAALEREERSRIYKETLAELQQLLPQLLAVVAAADDQTKLYSLGLVKAMGGLAQRIAERNRVESLLEPEPRGKS